MFLSRVLVRMLSLMVKLWLVHFVGAVCVLLRGRWLLLSSLFSKCFVSTMFFSVVRLRCSGLVGVWFTECCRRITEGVVFG